MIGDLWQEIGDILDDVDFKAKVAEYQDAVDKEDWRQAHNLLYEINKETIAKDEKIVANCQKIAANCRETIETLKIIIKKLNPQIGKKLEGGE